MNGKLPGKWRSKGDRYPKIVTSQTNISSSLEAVRTIFVKCDRYFFHVKKSLFSVFAWHPHDFWICLDIFPWHPHVETIHHQEPWEQSVSALLRNAKTQREEFLKVLELLRKHTKFLKSELRSDGMYGRWKNMGRYGKMNILFNIYIYIFKDQWKLQSEVVSMVLKLLIWVYVRIPTWQRRFRRTKDWMGKKISSRNVKTWKTQPCTVSNLGGFSMSRSHHDPRQSKMMKQKWWNRLKQTWFTSDVSPFLTIFSMNSWWILCGCGGCPVGSGETAEALDFSVGMAKNGDGHEFW